jgi:DNA-binding LacI/PurR family transcriptional regulator
MTAMQKLLDLPQKPTAVFACNDLMALGAWDAIENAGLQVGKDVALVGFDDIAQSSAPHYPLTTVRQAYCSMSEVATRMLMEKIKNPDNWRPRQITVPTELIVRHSCGAKLRDKALWEQANARKIAGYNRLIHSPS